MTTSFTGSLALVLVGHMPYLRAAGRRPDGEDPLHEMIAFSIVPVMNVLHDLRESGMRPAVSLAYSPILLEQLADIVVQKHFVVWMERWLARCEAALRRWQRQRQGHHAYLARFYLDWGQGILRSFTERYGRNLVAALRELCADGTVEPLGGAATHAYLPLLARQEAVQAQLGVGTLTITRLLGRRPRGIWLPECGFRVGLEHALRFNGARYFIADPASIASGVPVTHLRPRWVASRRLIVFLRAVDASLQIVSPGIGYVGDPLYLATRRERSTHLPIWRNGMGDAIIEPYDPYHAFRRAQEHAVHFAEWVAAELREFASRHDRPGIVVVPLDADVLGRRWFEGPAWLRALFETVLERQPFALTTPSPYLRAFRPRQTVVLRDGSWGPAGDHSAWNTPASDRLRAAVAEAENLVVEIARRFPDAHGDRERALNQAVRELMLAQSSDWLLLPGRNDSGEAHRAWMHLTRCWHMCELAVRDMLDDADQATLATIEEIDNPFAYLNYRVLTAETA
jgi:1,4-alpha-glucan branching enzyme